MIRVDGISMRYDGAAAPALDGVSFSVGRGERVALLGLNGAGKTTLLKILLGVVRPTGGGVVFAGSAAPDYPDALKQRFNALFAQKSQLWWNVPAFDSLEILALTYGIEGERFRATLAELDAALGLADLLPKAPRFMSFGQRLRCEVAASLVTEPDWLFLDEPFIGLDAPTRRALIRHLALHAARRGTTILLASHDLDMIERLVERALVLDRGRVVADGPLAALAALDAGATRVRLRFDGPPGPAALLRLNALDAIFPGTTWEIPRDPDDHALRLILPTAAPDHLAFVHAHLRDRLRFAGVEFTERMSLGELLGLLRDRSADPAAEVDAILAAADAETDPARRIGQLAALKRFSPFPAARPRLLAALVDRLGRPDDPRTRAFLLSLVPPFAAGAAPDALAGVAAALVRALRSPDARLAAAAVEAAGRCLADASASRDQSQFAVLAAALEAALVAPDLRTRANAYIALLRVRRGAEWIALANALAGDAALRSRFFYIFQILALHPPFHGPADPDPSFRAALLDLVRSLVTLSLGGGVRFSPRTVHRFLALVYGEGPDADKERDPRP